MGNLQPGRGVATQRKAAAYPWCTAAVVLSDVEDEGGTIKDMDVPSSFSFKKRKCNQISKTVSQAPESFDGGVTQQLLIIKGLNKWAWP